jgi:hypothetical protein
VLVVEPFLIGVLGWLGREIAAKGLDRLMDRVIDGPAVHRNVIAAVPVRRHDISGGAVPSSDADIVVKHQVAGAAFARVPVLLTFQDANHQPSDGMPFPMVLTETAHVTVRRGHYLVTALVLDLPAKPGKKPTLRSIGWCRLWIASNTTEKISIAGQHPTDELLGELGLKKPDGSSLFKLPPKPALPAASPLNPTLADLLKTPAKKPAQPVLKPLVFKPLPKKDPADWSKFIKNAPPPVTPIIPRSFITGKPVKLIGNTFTPREICRAKTFILGKKRCPNLVAIGEDVCASHLVKIRAGQPVFAYDTGFRLHAKP